MLLASVVLDIPTQSLDAPYSYVIGEDVVDVEVGCCVLVPFGHRKQIGFVVEVEDLEPADLVSRGLDPKKLKSVDRALSKPYFDEEGAACARFLSERYIAPLSSCVRLFTPPGGVPRLVRTQAGGWRIEEPAVGEVDDRWVSLGPASAEFTPRKNAAKQQAIMDVLARGDVRVAELACEFGPVSQTLKTLSEKGAVTIELRRRMRGVQSGEDDSFVPSPKPHLTEGQLAALEAIERGRAAGCGQVVLIDGVTGSGKTEVYLQAIEATLTKGRNAIVLVPEISLTPQTVARFRGRFGNTVAVMHSRMSQGERYDQWDFIRSGAARVVVGARSALFTPMANVGLIVIDEEHEGSYKQDSAPRYVSRDVAAWMVSRSGGVLVLGSATPSIEALYRCEKEEGWHRVCLPQRANGRALPKVDVIDMAAEFSSGSRSMFSGRLTRALAEELAAGRKAVLLLNQRGFAKFLLCRDCGFVPECPSCSTSLTYHEQGSMLACHHCGYRVAVPPVCPECGSPYLRKFGAGTQRVEAELRALLDELPGVGPGVPVIRMDADTTKGKGAHQRLLEQFMNADAAVLLGTQMIAKGLDFEDVTLVGVINADTQLHLPDFRAGERTFALIEQVAGRAGRSELPGRVMVQTYESDAVAIRAAARYDRALFLRSELPKRKVLGYPPYVRMANVLVWGKDEPEVKRVAMELYEQLERLVFDYAGSSWKVLPASPCVLEKLRGTYRWHILVKCPREANLSLVLGRLFRTRKPEKEVNVAVDVDPIDLL